MHAAALLHARPIKNLTGAHHHACHACLLCLLPSPAVCAAGHGGSSCTRCKQPFFSRGGSLDACQRCAGNKLAIDLEQTGRFAAGGSACMACPAGLVADMASSDCRCPASSPDCLCPAGWASVGGNGAPPCRKCGFETGTYADQRAAPGSSTCLRCPDGAVATDGTGCSCAPGSFSANGGPFAEGGCTPCPQGTIMSFAGATACSACEPGTVPNADATQCISAAASGSSW